MLKKLLIALAVLAALVAIFLLVAAFQPADFRVARSAVIAAPPATVFEQVNDLHKWQEWSPWAKLDPAAKISYAGPVAGKDAAFTWDGNQEVGVGTMTITESRVNELVQFKLEFKKPFEDTSVAEFQFKPEGDKTMVTWSMSGKKNLIGKAFGLIVDCDKMLGDQFQTGLGNLNALVTTPVKK